MSALLDKICSAVWGNGLIFLLISVGLLCTLRLHFIQLKMFPFLIKNRKNNSRNKGVSQLKTVCMSLGTAMGTGNITGVAAAVAIGGAGSVFWLWVSAFLGMAIVFAENTLSVMYSTAEAKGPMAYIIYGLRSRTLAVIFALFCIFAALGMGGMVQVNAFAESLGECISINRFIMGFAVFLLIFSVIKGGAERIGSAAQTLLPTAALLYAAVCTAVLLRFRRNIPYVFGAIFTDAFGIRQAAGGFSGYALSRSLSVGLRRGIFSNEAGLGSSPILHSAADSDSPELQGMWSMFEVFFDTIICCTLTALTILCTSSDTTVNSSFSTVLGGFSPYFLALEMSVFAFCTIIGWYYCFETACCFVSGRKSKFLPLIYALSASLGAVFTMQTVWTLSDIFNGLMAFPNLLALLLLSGKIKNNSPSANQ